MYGSSLGRSRAAASAGLTGHLSRPKRGTGAEGFCAWRFSSTELTFHLLEQLGHPILANFSNAVSHLPRAKDHSFWLEARYVGRLSSSWLTVLCLVGCCATQQTL